MNRKSLRGLRRHWRSHQQRATKSAELNLTALARFHVEYFKLGLAPWFTHQKPPQLFRQLWLGRLVTDLHQWHEQLTSHYPQFYLAVWLFEPRFGMSQLVTAVADRKRYYEGLFGAAQERALPLEYRDLPGMQDVCWTAYADVEAFWPADFAELGSWGKRKPHWRCETLDGQPYPAVQVGWVWVGQVPTTGNIQT